MGGLWRDRLSWVSLHKTLGIPRKCMKSDRDILHLKVDNTLAIQ